MDITVLPNNNHPEKLLQLDVGMLPATHGMFQIGAVLSSQKQWHNKLYSQREQRGVRGAEKLPPSGGSPKLSDRELEQHVTPLTLKPKLKQNPLYTDTRTVTEENQRSRPCWTIEDYDRQSANGNLADYLKEDPMKLNFWLEDLYTPGFDVLLKKKEAELKRNKMCKILTLVLLSICLLVIVIAVPIVVT
ncbi:major intrinsically disordered NOTCH2-binding receptor 1-like [Electrophorus electricus]|uniref:Major intrinsically disordered Notch2-binding receptor 1-like C-terminal domain-containing protein n=1 Tax=Electrophorus electricus TaxID=8005 RepID=A0A4W4GK36_ELEEL|nr:major intrinsically disordered NOTCH2-binding receptor 1-like [Electrophorus electricus]